MEDSVVYLLLANLLTIFTVMGNEWSIVHRQKMLSKMNRGEVEEVQDNFNNDTYREGNINIRDDSGGPLICRNNHGQFELLGTLSWGYESCFQDGYPDVFQLSYAHESWIETVTGTTYRSVPRNPKISGI